MVKFPDGKRHDRDPADVLRQQWVDEINNSFYEIRESKYDPGFCCDCGKKLKSVSYKRCWYHHRLHESLHHKPLNRYHD